jgi:hypothetical protein
VLGGSYKTAWFAEHRIRAALHEAIGAGAHPHSEFVGSDGRVYERAIAGRYRQLELKYLAVYQAEWALPSSAETR